MNASELLKIARNEQIQKSMEDRVKSYIDAQLFKRATGGFTDCIITFNELCRNIPQFRQHINQINDNFYRDLPKYYQNLGFTSFFIMNGTELLIDWSTAE